MISSQRTLGKALAIAFLAIFLFSGIAHADVWVNGYYRSNGTYVNGYYRTSPDGNPYNNYSYPGNYNPHTGVTAPGNSDTYLRNYYGGSSGGSGYNYSLPAVPTPYPSCPIFSSYNSTTGSCKCYSGYVSNGSSCVSANSYCWSKYGYSSSYNSLTDSCECDYGYELKYGACSRKESAAPAPLYHLDTATPKPTPKPIDPSQQCIKQYGLQSRYDASDGMCHYCQLGYLMVGDKCTPEPTPAAPAPARTLTPFPTSTPTTLIHLYTPTPSAASKSNGCKPGYSPSLSGRGCIALPANSHAAHNGTDVWLCNAGFIENGNSCILAKPSPQASPLNKAPKKNWLSRFLGL